MDSLIMRMFNGFALWYVLLFGIPAHLYLAWVLWTR